MKSWLDDLAVHAAGFRLRTGIPLLMIGFALAVSLVVSLRHAAEEAGEAEAAGLEQMAQRAVRLQSMLETYYRNRLEENVQDAVAQSGAQRGHRLAMVVDENGRVVAASRSLALGEMAEAVLPRLVRNADLLAEGGKVRRLRGGIVRLGAGGDSVAALFPVSFDAGKRSLGKERVGLLFIEHDLSERKAAARTDVQAAAAKLTAVILLFALLVWLVLDILLTRRLRRIVAAVRRIAETDFSARTGIAGRDEIGRVARAVDEMAGQLGEARRQLQHERDHLDELVAVRTAELRHANQALEAFSYSAAHDLQAPLRSIRGFSEIVLEEYGERLDEQGRGHLQRVMRAARRMSNMVEDLLAFSRSARGELHRETVDLSALADEIAAELAGRDPVRRIEWRIASDIVAEGDPSLLASVLANLLGNAWKYSAERETAVIDFDTRQDDGARIYCVRDNGVGFDPEQAAKIFEPFQRLHSQERFEGSGIGLATARRIVERHGGRIWAEAAPEGGATFCFTLGR
ncbi:MAG: HAMP domain-containing protein [Rhodocyclaceae bacterium]|jgi:signal transduction histidine kinase|nr:HAMP domain-containing protein [Rhodocyclaceae bacterium]